MTNDTPTPKTDACIVPNNMLYDHVEYVPAVFAREIERDLAAKERELETTRSGSADANGVAQELRQRVTTLKAEVERLRSTCDNCANGPQDEQKPVCGFCARTQPYADNWAARAGRGER